MKLGYCVQVALLATVLGTAHADDWSREEVISFDTRSILSELEEALAIHDEIPGLEKSKLIGRDRQDAEDDLNELIADAMALFESEAINTLRDQYRQLEEKIKEQENKLVEYRSERVLATREERSLRTQLVPGETLKSFVAFTKADYDLLIEATEKNISAYETDRANTLNQMRQALGSIGVDLSEEQLEAMMSSVIGDDIIEMSVVFNTIKDITLQLAELTQQSGENLAHAKKYYGMVVILHRMMGQMQAGFINAVDEIYLPKLKGYRDSALANIQESRKLIDGNNNRQTLENNIESNKLTLKVIDLYAELLKNQRDKVAKAHRVTQREISIADNTYKTVSLSSSVVTMLREGTNTFDQLISLQMPDIREFQNEEIREEFRKLTDRLTI
jgi:hypothetical protein